MEKADLNDDGRVNFFDKNDLQVIRLKAETGNITDIDQERVDTIKEVLSLVSAWTVTLEKEKWQSENVYDQVLTIEGRELGVEIIDEEAGCNTKERQRDGCSGG